MADTVSAMDRLANFLGPELYRACRENDVAQVQVLLSSSMDTSKWSAAMLAAASERATDVANYCIKNTWSQLNTLDDVAKWVWGDERLEPEYKILVESKLVNPEHRMDRTGQLLGVAAGIKKEKARHSLVNFLLEKGVDPDQRVERYGEMYALAAAASWSDKRMLEILLDHGATLKGSAALICAAEKGRQDNVEYLLGRGADVNEMTPIVESSPGLEEACSALHTAVRNGHTEVMDLLLNAGANSQLKDAKGRTVTDIAKAKGMDEAALAKLS